MCSIGHMKQWLEKSFPPFLLLQISFLNFLPSIHFLTATVDFLERLPIFSFFNPGMGMCRMFHWKKSLKKEKMSIIPHFAKRRNITKQKTKILVHGSVFCWMYYSCKQRALKKSWRMTILQNCFLGAK